MSFTNAEKFNKLMVWLKPTNTKDIGTDTEVFVNGQIILSGDFLIITENETDVNNNLTLVNKVYKLENILLYKIKK